MSANVPQVLSRNANVAAATGPGHNSGRGNSRNESGNSRPKRRRGQREGKADNGRGRESDAPRPPRQRQQSDGGKLTLRRLPPGMTEVECATILGETWAVGNGKVDWFSYIPGKIATDPAKPSRPARCYLHLLRKDDILALAETVNSATWEDEKNSFTNPSLVGPPSLELSAYKKVPSNKKRADAHQGTIDQDQEFMAFLEDLANPASARDSVDAEDGDDAIKGEAKAITTPLVEYLRERKTNKSKDSGSGKKRSEGRRGAKDDDSTKKRGRESKVEKSEKTEKGSKTTVKILTNKTPTEQAVDAARNAAKAFNSVVSQDSPKSKRAGIASAARILQRDLGLTPGNAHRRARQDAAKAEASGKVGEVPQPGDAQGSAAQSLHSATAADSRAKSNSGNKGQSGRRGREARNGEKGKALDTFVAGGQLTTITPPVILKKRTETQAANTLTTASPCTATNQGNTAPKIAGGVDKSVKAANNNSKGAQTSAQAQRKAQAVSAGATRAFIKNVMYNQGVTEVPLRQALESFGPITAIEMDKRKAFAYVDFVDRDALVKAIAASPLSIARGSVQILECRDKRATITNGNINASLSSAAANRERAKAGEKDGAKEKGSEPTRRGRRGRGGRGNNGGDGSNSQAGAAVSVAPTVLTTAAAANSGG